MASLHETLKEADSAFLATAAWMLCCDAHPTLRKSGAADGLQQHAHASPSVQTAFLAGHCCMQVAFHVEQQAPNLRPTYAALWHALSEAAETDISAFQLAQGIVMTGEDLSVTTVNDHLQCKSACDQSTACVSWTFYADKCHQKKTYGPLLHDPKFWSGLKTELVQC